MRISVTWPNHVPGVVEDPVSPDLSIEIVALLKQTLAWNSHRSTGRSAAALSVVRFTRAALAAWR